MSVQGSDLTASTTHDADPDREKRPSRKTLKKLGRWVIRVLGGVFLLGVLVLGLLQFDGVSTWLVSGLADRFNPYPGTQLTVDRVSGTWVRNLRFVGVRLTSEEGGDRTGPELLLDSLEVHFRLLPLVFRRLEIRETEIRGLRVGLTQRPDSIWDFLAPFQKPDEPESRAPAESGTHIRSGPIRIHGATASVTFAPSGPSAAPDELVVEEMTVEVASLEVGDHGLAAIVDTISARFLPPGEALDRVVVEGKATLAEGRVVIPGLTMTSGLSDVSAEGTLLLPQGEEGEVEEVDFHLQARPLAFRDLSGFARTLDPTLSAAAELRILGRSSRVEVTGSGTLSDGGRLEFEGTFTPSASGAVEYRLNGTLEDLRPIDLLGPGLVGGVVDGRVAVELAGNDLAHLQGEISAQVEGLRVDDRGIHPLVVSGGFFDGRAEVEGEAGADGLGGIDVSVGGRPLDPEPTLQLLGSFLQSGATPGSEYGPLEKAGIRDLKSSFAMETRGYSVHSAAADLEVEILQGAYGETSLDGGSLHASWDGGDGTFEFDQPLGAGRVTATGQIAWAGEEGVGDESSRRPGPSLPDANVLVQLREQEFRGVLVDSAVARIGLETGALSATAEAWEGTGGQAWATAQGRPFDAEPFLTLDSLGFSGIDLAPIAGIPSQLHGLARAQMEGFDPRTGNISLDLRLSPSHVGDTPVDSGEVIVSLSGGDLRVSGRLSSPSGTINLQGDVSPFAESPEFRMNRGQVRELNLGPFLGRTGLQSNLNLDLDLHGSGSSLGELETLGTLVFLPSTLNQGDIQGGSLELDMGEGEGTVRGQLLTGGGDIVLQALVSMSEGVDEVSFEGDLDIPELGAFLARPDGEIGALGRVALTWREESGLAFTSDLGGRIGEAAIDTLSLSGSLRASTLELDTIRLRSDLLRADGGGRLALRGSGGETGEETGREPMESDLSLTTAIHDLSPLAPLVGLEELEARSGRGDVHITGSAGAPSLVASMALGSWLVNGISGDSAWVRGGYDPTQAALEMWVQAPGNRGSIDLALRANPGAEEKRGTLDRLDVHATDAKWTLETQVPFSWHRGVQIDGLVLASDRGRMSVDGKIDPRGTQDLTLSLENATLSGVAKLLGMEELDLLANGRVALSGPAASPVAEGDLRVEVGVPEGGSASANARFSLSDGRLVLDVRAIDPAGGELTLDGEVPLAFSLAPKDDTSASTAGEPFVQPLSREDLVDLTLTGRAFDISWMRAFAPTGTLAALEGVLNADARARGPMEEVEVAGQVGLRDGLIHVSALGTTYREISLSAELQDQAIRIEQARISAGSGTAEMEGFVTLKGLLPEEIDLAARVDRFLAVNTPTVSGMLTGEVSLRGSLMEPRLAGELNLEGSGVGLDGLSSGNAVQEVELTEEDYQMLEDYFGYRVPEEEGPPSDVLEGLGLDLLLTFDRDVWVRRSKEPRISLEIRGNVDLEKEPGGELSVTGTIETLPERSFFRQFGRRFAVQQGELILTGDPSQFVLSMNAQWEVPSHSNPDEAEVVVLLGVSGDGESLELTLSSDPEMDEADIVSYLATGKPQSALGSSDADAVGLGTSMAMGAVAGVLEGLASDAVELDVVEIRADPVLGTTLIAGRYVSPDLYLGFRQPVIPGEDREGDQTQRPDFELEYRWFRWLTVNVQGGASDLRLFLKARHAY